MIVEERCYVLHTNATPQQYLEIYRKQAFAVQREALGGLIGYYVTEVGELNAIVSLWQYDSFEDRQSRRQQLASNPLWQDYLREIRPLIKSMQNRLLTPVLSQLEQ